MGQYTITVTPLVNGTSYVIDVTATNANGTGLPGVSNAGVPAGVPSAPLNPTAVAGNAQAVVTFSAPASTNGSTVVSYTVTAYVGGVATSIIASSAAAIPPAPITVLGLTNGTSYQFGVTATNGVGTSPVSALSNAVTPSAGTGFVITSTSPLAAGTNGVVYPGVTLTAGGGTSVPPYTFYTTGNVAPAPGLTLATNGQISGTPTAAGTFVEPYYAVDSSGGAGYPTSTQVALNEGPGGVQTPGGISTTSSVPIVAGEAMALLTTVATYGGLHAPPGLQSTPSDTFVNQTSWVGPTSSAAGTPINASQETVLWTCASPAGGTTTYQQWFGPNGYGGANPGDQDYPAFVAFQYSVGSTITEIGAFTAQTGTNYGGVANGTVLSSGPITLTSSQVPCTLYGFCINESEFGTPYAPSVGTVAGASAGTLLTNTWSFGTAASFPTLRQTVIADPHPAHGGSSTYTASFPEATLAGSTIVALATVSNFAGSYITNVSDPVNGSYTLGNDTRSSGNQDVALYYKVNAGVIPSTDVITSTQNAYDDYNGLALLEFTNVPTTNSTVGASGQVVVTAGATANNITTPSAAMGNTPITLVGFFFNVGSKSSPYIPTIGTGFTSAGTGWIWDEGQPSLLVETRNVVDPGTIASTAESSGGADTFTAQQIGIYGSSGGAPLATYASWNITTAGTYTANFVNNSGASNCYQTVGWTVQVPGGSGQTTPTKNLSITINASGGAPPTPTGLQMTLQGQTAAQQAYNPGGPPTFPNSATLTWNASTGATGYIVTRSNVYNGTYTTVATLGNVTTWTDSNAINCVGATFGSGPIYSPATNYCYKVIATNGSGQSAPSAMHVFNVCVNPLGVPAGGTLTPFGGQGYANDFTGGGAAAVNWGVADPFGGTDTCIQVVPAAGSFSYFLPVMGYGFTHYNAWTGAWNYVYMDLGITSSAGIGGFTLLPFVRTAAGDTALYQPTAGTASSVAITSYAQGTTTANGWTTFKIPLNVLLLDYGSPAWPGGPVTQSSVYKWTIRQNASITWYIRNVIFSAV